MDQIKIGGEIYYIPKNLKTGKWKNRRKNWVATYYFDKKKIPVSKDQIDDTQKVITSRTDYRKDIFYKNSAASKKDPIFDIYYKLKSNIPSVYIREKHLKAKRKSVRTYIQNLDYNKNEDIIVKFD